jgi:shikimate dehydrogenase
MSVSLLQPHLANRLDPAADKRERLAGIIGDRPSLYAKSPSLWNAVFEALKLDATYLAFDVDEPKLKGLCDALRRSERLLGCNVTIPYKVKVLEYLDDLDPKACGIGAVNTIVRTDDGRLVGYNTDGSGFLRSLTTPLVENEAPLLSDLRGTDVLMIGAGGSARAVAFYLADSIGQGELTIANRTAALATALADDVRTTGARVRTIGEADVATAAASAGLIVNCSTKGQAGLRKLPDGHVTVLEPYSSLAPATPATLPEAEAANAAEFHRRWFAASLADIERNNHASAEAVTRMAPSAVAHDLIYAPLETVFLRQCRLSGRRTANGKGMNIAQAVDALCNKVCRRWFEELGSATPETERRIVRIMSEAW